MFKIHFLILALFATFTIAKRVPTIDSSAHNEINLKITTENTKTSHNAFKPDLFELDPNDYKKTKNIKQEIGILEPSAHLLEKIIEINKTSQIDVNQTHKFEPNVEKLEDLISVHVNTSTAPVAAQSYGEYFHDQIIGFHGAILNLTNWNVTKTADLDDYAKWIELEKNLSKLNRFKKLHEEISDFENIQLSVRNDEDDRIVVVKDKKLSKKLELTIQQIEHNERKHKRFDL